MNTYLYRIDNIVTKEFYLGVRSCTCEIEKDPYMGSSSAWNKIYIKENKDNLVKTIVSIHEDRAIANSAESDLIEQFILDPLCVNRYIPKYYKEFMRRTVSEETRKLQSINNTGENNPFFGKTHTEEYKKKKAEERLGSKSSKETKAKLSKINTGEGNGFYGRKHTEEYKQAKSAERKGKFTGESNAFFGKTHSPETLKIMSEKKSGANNACSKPTILTDITTGISTTYFSFTELCRVNGFKATGAVKTLNKSAEKLYLKKYLINYATI